MANKFCLIYIMVPVIYSYVAIICHVTNGPETDARVNVNKQDSWTIPTFKYFKII